MISIKETNHNNSRSKRLYILAGYIALLLVVLVAAYYVFIYPQKNDPTKTFSPKYTTVQDESVKDAQQGLDQTSDKTNGSSQNAPTDQDIPVANTGKVIVVDLEQKNGFVNAKATVTDFTTTTCVYSFTSDGARPVLREQPGTCTGISIPQVEFEKIGTYTLTVTAYGSSEKISATKEITIR